MNEMHNFLPLSAETVREGGYLLRLIFQLCKSPPVAVSRGKSFHKWRGVERCTPPFPHLTAVIWSGLLQETNYMPHVCVQSVQALMEKLATWNTWKSRLI